MHEGMNEGLQTTPAQSGDLLEQALTELTPEQEDELNARFPDGAQTEEEQLLFTRILMEMTTSPDKVDIQKVEECFLKEREEALSKGGYDPAEYSVASGIVTPGSPLEQFKQED